ncbi:hypothetical protein [Nocardioides immobilis]|uniref:hypothetical protein n=1 Tax=Nocardioides immobilis TaxID=2049295 RepID=UPI003CCC5752
MRRHDRAAHTGRDAGDQLSWWEYGERVRRLASGLASVGVRPGDTVGIATAANPRRRPRPSTPKAGYTPGTSRRPTTTVMSPPPRWRGTPGCRHRSPRPWKLPTRGCRAWSRSRSTASWRRTGCLVVTSSRRR